MKKLLSICCAVFAAVTMLTGCGKGTTVNGKWDYAKQSLLAFDYGCTIETAEDYFGLTEADRKEVQQQSDETHYFYDISDWNIKGASCLRLSEITFDANGQTFPLGVRWITLGFDGEAADMQDFYQKQLDCCDEKYPLHDEGQYGYGDWNDYADAVYVQYATALAKNDPDYPNLHGDTFDPALWNEVMPLVDCGSYSAENALDNPDFPCQHAVTFNGLTLVYAKNDAYFTAKMQTAE